MRQSPCDVASLVIKHMSHCTPHDSMHLPFPEFLIILVFCLIRMNLKNCLPYLIYMFFLPTILIFLSLNELMFGDGHRKFGEFHNSLNYVSDPQDQDMQTVLNTISSQLSVILSL